MNNHPKYILRFFFDAGSGTCLWSGNDEARSRFGYPVVIEQLPIGKSLLMELHNLIERYDKSINWDDPGGKSPWCEHETRKFNSASSIVLRELRGVLKNDFIIFDELGVLD